MYPGDDQDDEHQPHLVRPHHPIGVEYLRIKLVVSEQRLSEPNAGEMGDEQRRDTEAERELQRLDGLPAELAAFVERPDAEPGMDQRGGIEQGGDWQELPE